MNPKNIKKCHTTITNCHTTIVGCRTTIAGCHTTIAGCRTTIDGCQTTIAGCHTTIDGCRTTIAGCHTTIAGCHTTITGCRTTFFAFCTSECFKKMQIRPKLLQNNAIRVSIQSGRQPFTHLRSTIHKVGNRWVKAPRRAIASALADKEFMSCWLFGLPTASDRG
jgi:hypothetical protein